MKMKDKVTDKYVRVYKNQPKEQRAEALRDYKLMVERENDPWRISLYALWTDKDIERMVKLLEESLI